MLFRQISDPKLAQYSYLVGCQRTNEALLVDPERDIDRYLAIAEAEGLRISAVTETHIHADFLSGTRQLAKRTGAKLYLSDEGDADWKYEWPKEGDHDVTLLKHGDEFRVGNIAIRVLHTPGHTPEHLSFLVTDQGGGMTVPIGLLSGDFVFVGDLGRPDLLESAAGIEGAKEPSARQLFQSLDQFLSLPDFLQVWPAHGAGSACGKALGAVPTSTVGYERRANAAIEAAAQGQEHFVRMILDGQPEPPLYFARMKRLNKMGVPLLDQLPRPKQMSVQQLADEAAQPNSVVLDTRLDPAAFMSGHLPGALHAPLDRTFPTIAASYVGPEERIFLVIDESRVDDTVRDLVRIGLDRTEGFIRPDDLEQALALDLATTRVIDFARLEELRHRQDVKVLDVRGQTEHEVGHVPDALNIAHTRLLDRLEEIPKDQKVLVHCASGRRAAAAAALLERHGFDVCHVDQEFEEYAASKEQAATVTPVG